MCTPTRKQSYFSLLLFAMMACTVQSLHLWNAQVSSVQETQNDPDTVVTDTLRSLHHLRNKRWDYVADACHCSGFSVECLQDAFCKGKYRSSLWSCVQNCCGFKCVKTG